MTIDSDLTEFLAFYFSQDWDAIDPDPWGCVRRYAYIDGPVEEVEGAARQARQLVALRLPSEELYERLYADHGLIYMPARAGYEANDWLSQVAGVLEDAVSQRRAGA
ncbi:MAG: contact-dependent growth inhibition system immunity protein [Lapillicoccus sp.]